MSFQWVGSSRISTQQGSLRDYPEWNGSMFLKLNWGLLTEKNRLSSFLQHPQRCWGGLLRRTLWLVGTPANISAMWYSPRFRQKSEQLMQRDSRTLGELLLPVSRGPSHREITSQGNKEAPSRIPTRATPWWFTWQTLALLSERFTGASSRCRQNLKYENFTSSFGRLVKTLHQKACRTCSTIIFLHSTNQIIDLWRCRCVIVVKS